MKISAFQIISVSVDLINAILPQANGVIIQSTLFSKQNSRRILRLESFSTKPISRAYITRIKKLLKKLTTSCEKKGNNYVSNNAVFSPRCLNLDFVQQQDRTITNRNGKIRW